jgi:hypothetical protein
MQYIYCNVIYLYVMYFFVIYFDLPVVMISCYVLKSIGISKHRNEPTRRARELARAEYELS